MQLQTKNILSAVSIFYFLILSTKINAQNFIYSNKVGNYPYTNLKLIGKVNNNIIVFKYTISGFTDMKKPEMLIYNEKLGLLNKISLNSITPKISIIDFVNEGKSFAAIVQYFEDGISFCKMVSFDANGTIIKMQILDQNQNIDDKYVVIQSDNKKGFALLKVIPSEINQTIAIRYFLINNDSLIHSDSMIMPFDTLTSTLNEALLDDNNLLVCLTNSVNKNGRISLYKIDLSNNASVNTLRDVKDGYFDEGSVYIHSNDKNYIITGS